jgi:hypothetical protein
VAINGHQPVIFHNVTVSRMTMICDTCGWMSRSRSGRWRERPARPRHRAGLPPRRHGRGLFVTPLLCMAALLLTVLAQERPAPTAGSCTLTGSAWSCTLPEGTTS